MGLVVIGTTVNAVSAARKNGAQDTFGIVFGGIAMFGALATLGQLYDYRLAKGFAWLFVLGSILFRGEGVINWFNLALGSSVTKEK